MICKYVSELTHLELSGCLLYPVELFVGGDEVYAHPLVVRQQLVQLKPDKTEGWIINIST